MVNRFAAWSSTCRGAVHEKGSLPCQDASASLPGRRYGCGVVCDGHGGADYVRSDRGSRFAAAAFMESIGSRPFRKAMARAGGGQEREKLLEQLTKSIITRWHMAVEADLSEFPLTQEELAPVSQKARARYLAGEKAAAYGTTLIGFAYLERCCFGIQIGDGRCIGITRDGTVFAPIADDAACFLNVTTSLSGDNAFEKFRFFIADTTEPGYPGAVLLCSDGVSDSFTEENFQAFCALVFANLRQSGEGTVRELFDYLPTLSQKGSGDDMSLCVLVDTGAYDGY